MIEDLALIQKIAKEQRGILAPLVVEFTYIERSADRYFVCDGLRSQYRKLVSETGVFLLEEAGLIDTDGFRWYISDSGRELVKNGAVPCQDH